MGMWDEMFRIKEILTFITRLWVTRRSGKDSVIILRVLRWQCGNRKNIRWRGLELGKYGIDILMVQPESVWISRTKLF
jgi:hypothetical protein